MTDRLAELTADLRKHSSADVRLDLPTRLLYSTDASNYQVLPLAVVTPRHYDDVLATAEACIALNLPMLPRGGGSSLAGQAVGEAVIVDFSRYLDQVLAVDARRRRVLVQAGAILGALNRHLAAYGLMVGPDPASADRATVGGVIANNATGAHSTVYGQIADHVVSLRTVLADGKEARLGPVAWPDLDRLGQGDDQAARLHRQLPALVAANRDLIDARFPRYWRRSGGYNLDRIRRQLDQAWFNPAALLAGSEGTLGLILEAELDLVPIPRHKALAVVHFASAGAAFRAVPGLLTLDPAAIELIDDFMLGLTRVTPQWRRRLTFVEGEPKALLVLEFAGDEERSIDDRLLALDRHLRQAGHRQPVVRVRDPAGQANVWEVRKAGLGLLMSLRGDAKPVPGIEDVAVPPEHLADYMAGIHAIMAGRGVASAMYAHASAGCIHLRPILNLKTSEGVQHLVELTAAAAELARRYGGVLSSEHGEGLARSHFSPSFHGPEIYDLFRQVKRIFDPQNLFNPGKVVDAPAPDQNLRYGPDYQTIPLLPALDWSQDGSFAQAVEMCNGAGVCRKLDVGTMCPSFQATREEMHSTRGRANLLRACLSGALLGGLDHPALTEALDLCLGCKACKTECPSSVDMTRLKAEAYAQKYRHRRPPLSALAFGNIDRLAALAAPAAPLANLLLRLPPTRWLAGRLLHLHPHRPLPLFQRRTFTARQLAIGRMMGAGRTPSAPTRRDGRPRVALFADTFTEFNEPGQGLAAVRVLEAAGCQVELAPRLCCGRPALSQGLVPAARGRAEKLIRALLPFAHAGIPVVGLEPSCVLTIRDDFPTLAPGPEAQAVAENVHLLDEHLAGLLAADLQALPLRPHRQRYLVHGHCHQKALVGMEPTLAVLAAIPGAAVAATQAGCCGMAGAFGYSADHYDVSVAIANDRLLPAVKAAPQAILVANGVSCRQQIRDLTGRQPLHLAEALAELLF